MTESPLGVLLVAALLFVLTRNATRRTERQQARDVADQQRAYLASGFGREMGHLDRGVDRVRQYTAERAVIRDDWDRELRRLTEGER